MAKILVIDDSSFQRKILSSILKEAGYEILTAENGKEALERLAESSPDLVISDLLMPEYDGFYLLDTMRDRHIAVPALILTSDIQNPTREKCYRLGAQGLLNKPVHRETLLAVVKKILAGERV